MRTYGRYLHLRLIPTIAALASLAGPAFAQTEHSRTRLLADMTLEELADIPVFSASRQLEPTRGVPSAIFVLTGEDLRRAGVTNVPDALRLVPGVQVGRVDANKWAVSMRGFNSREANKLLVLVDGRSIYDPLFSGVLWESQDFLLEDIERIEVIRGPGGAVWGANAFNGVINIITRHTQDTIGTFASLAAGDEERYIAAFRQGWHLTDTQSARVYVKARERDTGFSEPLPPFDASRDVIAGFRWDLGDGFRDNLRVSGDVFEAHPSIRESPTLVHEVEHRGRNILARWERQLASGDALRLQFYYDGVDYDSIGFAQDRDTYDLEFQQDLQAGAQQSFVWGAGLRRTLDHSLSKLSGFVDVLPARRHDRVNTVFVQDTIALTPDALQLVLGLKYEATDYASSKILPNVRLAWAPTPTRTLWAAVSEATRVPSRLEADLTFFNTIRIGDAFGAEEVRAYEVGQRRLVSSNLWYDLAIFYNDYDDLRTTEANGSLANLMHGNTKGLELALRWEPLSRLRIDTSYTYLDMDLALDPESTAAAAQILLPEGLYSRHQLAVRSVVQVRPDLDLDATLRYADELRALQVPAYTQFDVAFSWRPRARWELSLVGTNLLDSHQPEQDFAFSASGLPTEVERSVYLKASLRR
jgi:iron complex outermembrane receptor protein